jgi:thiol-disulfide isomerase/thioredoxin
MPRKSSLFVAKLPLLLLFMLGVAERTSAKTTLSGEIGGLKGEPLQLVLQEDINRKKSKVISTISVDRDGRFKLERELAPHIYELRTNSKKLITLAVESGQNIVITGDASDPGRLQVTGSVDTLMLADYEDFRKESLGRLVLSIRDRIKKLKIGRTPDNDPLLLELTKLEIDNTVRHRNELIEYIKERMGTSLAIYPTSIRWAGDDNLAFLIDLAGRFEKAHPNTEVAARVNEKVQTLRANNRGGRVAEIKMPDKDGKIVPLSSLKAKYVLIDFWASWCAPCRGESRLLTELYQRFRSEGFEIYGVGLESEKNAWLRAIDQDKRIWTNVSTFQEFETPASFDYAVTSLPANILIDNSGKIIAKNLHGGDLKAAVESLFLDAK